MPKSNEKATLLAQLRSSRPKLFDGDAWKIWGPLIALTLTGFVVAWLSIEPAPSKEFRICAGEPDGAYFAFAQKYAGHIAAEGFTLAVVQTVGSLENLQRMRAGECDAAFVQGGVSMAGAAGNGAEDSPEIQSLASVYREPLWVFHRSGLELDTLAGFEGRTLTIGPEGSGTRILSRQLLRENGIGPEQAELLGLPEPELLPALKSGRVDAIFLVASPRAAAVRELLATEGVELYNIRRHQAYKMRFRFLSSALLGEGAIDIARNIPPRDVTLLTTAAILVARSELHSNHVALLLDAARRVHRSGGMFEQPNEFPSTLYTEFPMRDEALRYLESGPTFLYRHLPFGVAASIDRLKILLLPLVTLLFPLFKVAPPLYRWRIRSKIYRWYDELRALDIEIEERGEQTPAAERLRALEVLEDEVNEITVPLAYMDEFYHMRAHIALVRVRLRELQRQQVAEG